MKGANATLVTLLPKLVLTALGINAVRTPERVLVPFCIVSIVVVIPYLALPTVVLFIS